MFLILALAAPMSLAPAAARAQSADALAVGAMANFTLHASPAQVPDIRFRDETGRETSLGDYAGRVLLLNLWATWCGPCRREMPDLDRLQADLGGDRFAVLALSSDRQGPSVVRRFYDELEIRHLSLFNDDKAKAQRQLRAFGLPTTLLIDEKGRELGRMVGPAEWASPEAVALLKHFIARTGS